MSVTDAWENFLADQRCHARVLKTALEGIAGIYGLIVTLRELAFLRGVLAVRRLPAPVISIGNITAGGTGKTPATIWVARRLRQMGSRLPIILSRGYGQDEAQLFHDALPDTPHFIHRRRFLGGLAAIHSHGEHVCFVLDDGFQHRHLHRDLDIVLIDASQPFGYRHMLPRGFLREPVSHLRRAHVVMVSKCDLVSAERLQEIGSSLRSLAPQALYCEAMHAPVGWRMLGSDQRAAPASLAGKKCLLFAGIGRPKSFLHSVQKLGVHAAAMTCFPDHHAYTGHDMERLSAQAKSLAVDCLLTTAKDAVKLGSLPLPDRPVWILDIELVVRRGEQELSAAMQDIIDCAPGQSGTCRCR